MNQPSLLQTFALANSGNLVSVEDVDRGARCGCICPACQQPLIARQGEVRIWHFAHAPGAECTSGAETALHLAAKEAIRRAGGFMLPAILHPTSHRMISGAVLRPECWIDFQQVDVEVQMGSRKPDVVGRNGDVLTLIEVAVTHRVDQARQVELAALGHSAVEVDLAGLELEGWTWDQLKVEVVEGSQNKRWLNCLDLEVLLADLPAPVQAVQATPSTVSAGPPRLRYRRAGQILDLIVYPFGVVLWAPYNETLVAEIKAFARQLGGRYQPKFRSWLYPTLALTAVQGQVENAGFRLSETR